MERSGRLRWRYEIRGLHSSSDMTKTEYNKKYWLSNRVRLTAMNRDYYLKNRTALIASAKEYVEKNKTSTDAYQQKYRQENRNKRKLQCREWRKNHPDRARKSYLKYFSKNYESIRRRQREYNRRHPEKTWRIRHKRRAQKAAAKIQDVEKINQWEAEWRKQLLVQCFYCKQNLPPSQCHLDHMHPLNPKVGHKQGGHTPENVVIACAICNQRKNNMPLEKWMSIIKKETL